MKPIPGYDKYYVNEAGTVFRTDRSGQIVPVKPYPDKYGYHQVRMKEPAAPWNGKLRKIFVHHIVAWVFLPPKPTPKHEVRHMDGNKDHNYAANLEWGTHQQNEEDKERHGTKLFGEKIASAKLSNQTVLAVKERLARGEHAEDIAKELDVSAAAIKNIEAGKYWGHVKATFKHIRCLTCKKPIKVDTSFGGKFCNKDCAAQLALKVFNNYKWNPTSGAWYIEQ